MTMKNILNFNEFKSNRNINPVAIQYLNNEITETQLESYIFSTNEGVIGDFFKNIKEKILDVFYTFLMKAMGAKDILKKVLNFAQKIVQYIQKFKKKHPILFKAILVFIIIVILLLISSQQIQAHEIVNGKLHLTNTDELNTAYGFIDANYKDLLSNHATGVDASQIAMEAKTYLKELINGNTDQVHLHNEAISLAKTAIKTIQDAVKHTNDTNDANQLSHILNYLKDGMSHTLEIVKNGNTTTVTLK